VNMKNQLLPIFAVGLLAGPTLAQAEYAYQTIDHPGAPDTQVFGINDRGDVVGAGFAAPRLFPFVYGTKKGVLTDVPPVAGYDATSVLGISDSGILVGSVRNDDPFWVRGLMLDRKGSATVFDYPNAVSFTQARGINNMGLVTGYRDSVEEDVAREGFIYDPKTDTFTDIVPSYFTIAQGINARGDVVGSAIFFSSGDPCAPSSPSETVRYGWLRTADGTVTYFDVNGGRTSARDITDSGTIVGFVTDTATGLTNGFVVELDSSQCQSISVADTDLLKFPGAADTLPGGIKNSGEVVGSYLDGTNAHGFIATPR
jgi:uncharacterized membrane protein